MGVNPVRWSSCGASQYILQSHWTGQFSLRTWHHCHTLERRCTNFPSLLSHWSKALYMKQTGWTWWKKGSLLMCNVLKIFSVGALWFFSCSYILWRCHIQTTEFHFLSLCTLLLQLLVYSLNTQFSNYPIEHVISKLPNWTRQFFETAQDWSKETEAFKKKIKDV